MSTTASPQSSTKVSTDGSPSNWFPTMKKRENTRCKSARPLKPRWSLAFRFSSTVKTQMPSNSASTNAKNVNVRSRRSFASPTLLIQSPQMRSPCSQRNAVRGSWRCACPRATTSTPTPFTAPSITWCAWFRRSISGRWKSASLSKKCKTQITMSVSSRFACQFALASALIPTLASFAALSTPS